MNNVNSKTGKELLLELSYDCNLRCIHCSSINCQDKIKINDLSKYETIIQNIDTVRLSGGEPLLNDDLINFVNYFHDRDIKVILQTNGFKEIPENVYNKLSQINLSVYSDEPVHNFITQNIDSFKKCQEKIEEYYDITLCSPIFTLVDSLKVVNLVKEYDSHVRFTSLLNHGRCNFAKPIEEQINIFQEINKEYINIENHCSLTGYCDAINKFVIKPDLTLFRCASNKQGLKLCKKSTQ